MSLCNKGKSLSPNPTCEVEQIGGECDSLQPLLVPSSEWGFQVQNLGCGTEGVVTPANSNSILLDSCTYPTPR